MSDSHKISSGVQELIDRLREEGVQTGLQDSERLIQEAQKQAAEILAKARTEADDILAQANDQIQAQRAAAHEELQLAVRDTVLELKSRLVKGFEEEVQQQVSMVLKDNDYLRRLILAITGQVATKVSDERALEVLLSNELFPEKSEDVDKMRDFIQSVSADVMRQGIELKASGSHQPGIRLRVVGEDMEVDMTDKSVAALILKYLSPRYRAYVEGDRSSGSLIQIHHRNTVRKPEKAE